MFRKQMTQALVGLSLFSILFTQVPAQAQAATLPHVKAATPSVKATWLWNTDLITTSRDTILSFAKQNGVNLIYLQINPQINNAAYQSFIQSATSAGIQVQALDGASDWGLTANQDKIAQLTDWVKTYNASSSKNERFQGIHVDIEPYVLPEWSQNQSSVISQWATNMNVFAKRTRLIGLSPSADLPAWLDTLTVPTSGEVLSHYMIRTLDQVTLMAYRDHATGPNGIVEIVQNELKQADTLGKKVIIGVETNPSGEGDEISFYEESKAYMNQQLATLQTSLQGHASYGGQAIHDYNGWRNLKD